MSVNLGEIAATTLKNRQSEVVDNVENHNALLNHLKKNGKISTMDGGRTIDCPLTYAENSTTKFYDGAQESFSIPIESNIDAATYDWKFHGGFIYFTEAERVKNSGKHAAVRLLKTKISNLKATTANDISTSLYSDGTGSSGKEFGGLALIIDADPTSAGTVGGIDQVTYTFWRNKYSAATATTSSTIQARMKAMWLSIQRGTDVPDLIVADSTMFTYYWDSLSDLQRFTQSSEADVTKQAGVMFQQCPVLYDSACTTKSMYFINSNHLEFVTAPGRKFAVGSAREVTNANYQVVPMFTAGNLICSRRASQGVIIAS